MLRHSAAPLLTGLGIIVAVAFFEALLYLGVIYYVIADPGVEVSDWVLTALGVATPLLALVSGLAAVVFGAGLLGMLVQRERGGGGALGYAFAAFRRSGWLLLVAIAAALVLPVLVAMLVVPAVVALSFGVYTVPLIVDRRLPMHVAIEQSIALVRTNGVLRHILLVLGGALVCGAAWAVPYLVTRVTPGLRWVESGNTAAMPDMHGVAGLALTTDEVAITLLPALALGLSAGIAIVLMAAMYVRATQTATAGAHGAPPVPPAAAPALAAAPRSARWPLAGTLAGVVLLAAAGLFVWWIASPGYDPLADHDLRPGAHVTMDNGLSLTVPTVAADQTATYERFRQCPDWLKVGENVSSWSAGGVGWRRTDEFDLNSDDAGVWFMVWSFRDDTSSWLRRWTTRNPVALASPDGGVRVLWKKGGSGVAVITHLPGQGPGWLRVTNGGKPLRDLAAVRRLLARAWREYSIEGATVPVVPKTLARPQSWPGSGIRATDGQREAVGA
jgi:hypothetical protein